MSNFTQKAVSMASFGPSFAAAQTVGFADNDSPYRVEVDPDYRFDDVDAMRIMTLAWGREWTRSDAAHRKGVLFFGPTGSGKSSFVEQFFARLQVPLLRITWNPKREADQVLTDRILIDGMLLDRDQALTIAARQGLPVIINEIDLADPAELVALNDAIERGVITMPNGEVVVAQRGFMVFATANTAGVEDNDGVYHGTQSQNASTLRRFFKARIGYPTLEQEVDFLQKGVPGLDVQTIEGVAQVAVRLRQAFEGTLDGYRLSKPMSRPEALDWAQLIHSFSYLRSHGVNVAKYALGFAFTNGMPEADMVTVNHILENFVSDGGNP